ncbi:MAG: alpha/beta hydrolase [Pseudomonadota bacterium]
MIRWGLVAAAALGVALGFFLALSYAADTDPAEMREIYANDRSAFAPADGYSIHYRDQGRRDGPALILLHGLGASLHTFEPLVDRLGSDWRIITIDLPGHGLTGPHPREDYSMSARFAALDAVTEKIDLAAFALGGNSMGGEVAWSYAIDNPEAVSALILLDPSGAPTGNRRSAIGAWFINSALFEWLGENITPRWFIAASLDASVSNKDVATEAAIDRYWNLLRLPGNRRAQVIWSRLMRDDARFAQLIEITAPTLILWGGEDRLIPPETAERFAAAIADSEVIIYETVGHLPMEEAADETAADIDKFLRAARAKNSDDPAQN